MTCIFCKIINKEFNSNIVYEDDNFLAFLDIKPENVGHTLIVPKKHIVDITDMDNITSSNLLDVIKKVKIKLENKLNIDGLTIIQNNGIAQEVKHFHIHLIPKYNNDPIIDNIYDKLKETN